MLKSFQKAMIIESAKGQKARNLALQEKVLAYISTESITLEELLEIAEAVEPVFVPRYTTSMALSLKYSSGTVVTLRSALNYDDVETKLGDKVSSLPVANSTRNLFVRLGGLAFIA